MTWQRPTRWSIDDLTAPTPPRKRPAIPSIVTDPFEGPPADDVPDSLDVGREHDDTTRQSG
jgi:hypothetical protein